MKSYDIGTGKSVYGYGISKSGIPFIAIEKKDHTLPVGTQLESTRVAKDATIIYIKSLEGALVMKKTIDRIIETYADRPWPLDEMFYEVFMQDQ